jgi:MFS family permease
MGGFGAAAGPLIGGVIATWIDWRAAFVFQALIVAIIILLSRNLSDPLPADPSRPFDLIGAVLSAVGMFFVVFGILQAGVNNALCIAFVVLGIALLLGFYAYIRRVERAGKEPLLSTGLFHNRVCNLALVTQNLQWLIMMGTSFVVSVYLQEVHGYSPIRTGLIFTSATAGILISSFAARGLVARYSQRALIATGFLLAVIGLVLMIPFVDSSQRAVAFLLGLFLFGLGVGVMLTPSVNVVQSSFPEEMQGEISGLSRSVSNLGSSFGTAIAGTILVSAISLGTRSYVVAMIVLVGFALLGLVATLRMPRHAGRSESPAN